MLRAFVCLILIVLPCLAVLANTSPSLKAHLFAEQLAKLPPSFKSQIADLRLKVALLGNDETLVRAAIKEGAIGNFIEPIASFATETGREATLLRALAAEDKFGGFDRWNGQDKAFLNWIYERYLLPVIKGMLADPQFALPATVRAKLAVMADDEEMFQQALAEGANHHKVWSLLAFSPVMFEHVIARLEEGSLHHAAAHGKHEAIDALLAAGADINAVDQYGWSALDYAVFSQQVETTRALCEADADVCVFAAAQYKLGEDAPTVKILRAYAGDKHPTEECWLHYYIRTGQTARAINHIQSQPDPDKFIYIGVSGVKVGNYKDRQDIDDAGLRLHPDSALHAAALYGDLELAKYLIETMHMDANYIDQHWLSSNNTTLHMAAVGNHVDMANYLLAQGADVNVPDTDPESLKNFVGLTAMHYAAAYGNLEMAMWLSANGADANAVGSGRHFNYWLNVTPLQLAIEGDANLELVEFLIKKLGIFKKRKINQADGKGLTALYRAVRSENVAMVELLLNNGADPALLLKRDKDLLGSMRWQAEKDKDTNALRMVELLESHLSP